MRRLRHAISCAVTLVVLSPLSAQPSRIVRRVDASRTVALPGHLHPLADSHSDQGRLNTGDRLGPVTVIFRKTPEQQAELDRLLREQQNPVSPEYHRWLTPEQYAERFGLNADDTSKVAAWLRSQGLSIESVARSRTWIAFSGEVGRIESALGTQIHRYLLTHKAHFAPAVEPRVPEALEPVIAAIDGLDDFESRARRERPADNLTNGRYGLGPGDWATIYDVGPLYNSGIDGTGQKIVVAGRTNLDVSDIQTFRSHFGLSKNDPEMILFGPDPGTVSGDVGEATLDVAWSGAIARNATILYVYSTSVFTSVQYAVDQNLAPVISYSYGYCERFQAGNAPLVRRAIAQQANAQGITWIASSGDSGGAACEVHEVNPLATKGKSASFPATLPEVTAVGGTEFNEGSGKYWAPGNTSTFSSALSYIPEVAWNDTASENVIEASGGGPSILYSKPAWQSAPGVPSDGARDTPDIALAASWVHDGYLIYRSGGLCLSGGTSAAAPAFAGVLALLNHYLVSKGIQDQPGLGNVNPALYRLAQTNPEAFHDIAAGDTNVPCPRNSTDCTRGYLGYTAGTGYDLATGLGSIDVFNFVTSWNTSGAATTTTATADPADLLITGSLQLTATVAAASGSTVPTGSVTFSRGTTLLGTAILAKSEDFNSARSVLKLSGGVLDIGTNVITASYSGDATWNGSAGTISVSVRVPTDAAAVVPTIIPNPVYQQPPDADGYTFFYNMKLTEVAGVGATLTGMTIDGFRYPVSTFFSSPNILPRGSIIAGLRSRFIFAPTVIAYGFSGIDANGNQWSQETPVQFYGPAYFSVITGLSNAASGQSVYAPGMALSVYGSGLASLTETATSLPLPATLANVSLTVNGVPAPLYFVSSGQINVQIPYETQTGAAVLDINSQGNKYSFSFLVQSAAPGIFTDLKKNTVPFASAARGQTVTLFITGEGTVSPALASGATPPPDTPVASLPAPTQSVSITIANVPATIQFIGIPPGLAGVTQVNFTVPNTAPLGAQSVVVTVGAASSLPATLIVNE